MTCIDLTTLSGDDTPERVRRLCAKARRPLSDELLAALGLADLGLTVAAVCVYPTMVAPAVKALEGSGIPVASVATGFPAGLTPLEAAARGDPLRGRRGRGRDRHRHHPRPRARPRLERALRRGRGDARSLRASASEGDPRHGRSEDAAQRLRRQHGRDAGGRRLHQDLDRQGGRQRHASGEPGDGPGVARLSRARRRRHRLQAGGRPANDQGRARLAHPDEGGARPAVDAARPLPHRRERPARPTSSVSSTITRPGAIRPPIATRWREGKMGVIKDILRTMDYGPSPEGSEHVRAWLEEHAGGFGLFINGAFTRPHDLFDVFNPATGERIARATQGSPADVDAAVAAARKAQAKWAALSGFERSKHLYALARHVQKRERFLSVLETIDNGKPIRELRDIDIPLVARHFYHHAGWASLIESEFPRTKPVGVCGQIIPWNFPLLMLAWKIAPALAAGNTVVLKPAEYTPLTALAFAAICVEAGLPRGRGQHRHRRRRDRRGARRPSGRRQDRLHRLDRSRPGDSQGDCRHGQEAVARARRQIAVRRVRGRRPRQRGRGRRRRDLVQPGAGLLRRLAAPGRRERRRGALRQAARTHGEPEGRRSARQVDRRRRDRRAGSARTHQAAHARGREGRARVLSRRRFAARSRLLLSADAGHRRRAGVDPRARGNLRSGAGRDDLPHAGRGGRARQQHPLWPRRFGLDRERQSRARGRGAHQGRRRLDQFDQPVRRRRGLRRLSRERLRPRGRARGPHRVPHRRRAARRSRSPASRRASTLRRTSSRRETIGRRGPRPDRQALHRRQAGAPRFRL